MRALAHELFVFIHERSIGDVSYLARMRSSTVYTVRIAIDGPLPALAPRLKGPGLAATAVPCRALYLMLALGLSSCNSRAQCSVMRR